MYGDKIYTPTTNDSLHCFEAYKDDVVQRQKNNQLRPGEDVKIQNDGRVQISGEVAVMGVNGLMVKTVFDNNTNREFFIEESFPLDLMYPYLEPHGLIFKINRAPLTSLPDGIILQDRDYWMKYLTPLVGDWMNTNTPLQEVISFAEKVYLKHDFDGFKGDLQFIQNADAQGIFSKRRNDIADLYVWRMNHAANASERERMAHEADFAFRQAFALCPSSPGGLFRYVNLLLSENRLADAILIAETVAKFPSPLNSDVTQIQNLVDQLKRFQKPK
jgi:hypothetical protein